MPVVGHVVLQELQIAVALELPEVRLLHHEFHGHHLRFVGLHGDDIRQIHLLGQFLVDILTDASCLTEVALIVLHQVRTTHIDIHQRLVNGIRHLVVRLRIEGQCLVGTGMIERGGCKQTIVASVSRLLAQEAVDLLDRVQLLAQHVQRVDVVANYLCRVRHSRLLHSFSPVLSLSSRTE